MAAVYIVDEEYHFAENVASALRFEGRDARVFHDATEALYFFSQSPQKILASNATFLIDVSLAAGDDLSTFSSELTDDFYKTGLVLVEALLRRCPGLCVSKNTILYTAHFKTELWDKIEQFCSEHGFRSWQKSPDSNVDDVVRLVLSEE